MALKKTKQIDSIMSKLDDVKTFFEELAATRQDSYDNKSEKWQDGDKGQEEQENISALEDIVNNLESATNDIDNLFEE